MTKYKFQIKTKSKMNTIADSPTLNVELQSSIKKAAIKRLLANTEMFKVCADQHYLKTAWSVFNSLDGTRYQEEYAQVLIEKQWKLDKSAIYFIEEHWEDILMLLENPKQFCSNDQMDSESFVEFLRTASSNGHDSNLGSFDHFLDWYAEKQWELYYEEVWPEFNFKQIVLDVDEYFDELMGRLEDYYEQNPWIPGQN